MVAPSDAMVDEYMAAMQTNATDGMRRREEERGRAGRSGEEETEQNDDECVVRSVSCVVRRV